MTGTCVAVGPGRLRADGWSGRALVEEGRRDRVVLSDEVLGGLEERTGAVRHDMVRVAGRRKNGRHRRLVHGSERPSGSVVSSHAAVLTQLGEQQTQHVVDEVSQVHHGPGRIDEILCPMFQIQGSPS